MLLLSIIVPAYNVDAYLERCIKSLYNQQLTENSFEVIIVNDGSTDSTGKIAKDLMTAYSHLQLIEQSNLGLSASRNAGLRLAKGKFLLFVDADDYLIENTLPGLLDFVNTNNLEIGIFSQLKIDLNGRREFFRAPTFDNLFVSGEEIYVKKSGDSACKYLIKLDFLINNDLYFNEDAIYFEDAEWGPRVFSKAQRCGGLDVVFYVYELRRGSLTTSHVASLDKTFESYMLCAKSLKSFQNSLVSEKRDFLNQSILKFVILPFFMITSRKEFRRYLDVLKLVRVSGFTKLNLNHVNGNGYVYGRLFNLHPIFLMFYLTFKLFSKSKSR
jgi:glycosyltransferase involved in cell wall biosynthesis